MFTCVCICMLVYVCVCLCVWLYVRQDMYINTIAVAFYIFVPQIGEGGGRYHIGEIFVYVTT